MIGAKEIYSALESRYLAAIYRVPNVYVFLWETDYFVLQRSKYCYDIEIKVSRADYFKDFDKIQRHQILSTGEYRRGNGDTRAAQRPNRFYFCVPEGLIKVDEVPEYAGLMYCGEAGISIVKEAKFLHKDKFKGYGILCDKFYFRWRALLNEKRRNDTQ